MPFQKPEPLVPAPPHVEQTLSQVIRKNCSNGLTVLVQEDHSNPLVAFHAVVRAGSATEGRWMGTGISHVVEHMLFKGTPRRTVGAMEREAREYGGTSQGFTTFDTTAYQVVVNKEFWSQGADLLVDALFHPTMDPEEFTKERQVVLRELKLGKDDPGHLLWDRLFENAYRTHPYRVPIIGYEPLVKRLTREDVLEYHRSRYHPNAIVIGVSGDVEPQAVIRRIEELTAEIPPGAVAPEVLPQEPRTIAAREVDDEAEAAQPLVGVGFPSVSLSDPDLYALDVLAWLLGGGRGSRLERSLEEGGIVHSVSCSNFTPRDPGLFVVMMRMDPANVSTSLDALAREIHRAQVEEFTPPEVEAAKRALLTEYFANRQTVTAQAADLALFEVLVGDPAFAHRYIEEVGRVTSADLKRVANAYLVPERSTTVKLLPKGTPSALNKKERSQTAAPLLEEKVVLDNGVRVILHPDRRLPLVTVNVCLLGGVRYEEDSTNGISALTARMLIRGTRHKTEQEIVDLVRDMGGELAPSSGRNSMGLTLEVMSAEFPRAVHLLSELLQEPTFPSEELEKERRLLLADLKVQEENPFPWGMKRLCASLFAVHPYRLDPAGDSRSVKAFHREALVSFYNKIRDPKEIVLTAVGDFRKEELVSLLQETLGRVGPTDHKTPFSVPQEPARTGAGERLETSPRQEGLVMIGFPGLAVTDPRVPVLDLVETVLSGGAGRLFTQVRERRGLAYTVGAFGVHGVDPGTFVLYAVTEPAQIQSVRQALLEEIRRLGTTPVPEEEFRVAQQGLLGARRIARQTQAFLATQLGLDELYGLGYDFSRRYEEKLQAATPSDLQEVAKTLLDPQRCIVVIGQPGKEDHPSLRANEVSTAISR